jgi:hypothetical protein
MGPSQQCCALWQGFGWQQLYWVVFLSQNQLSHQVQALLLVGGLLAVAYFPLASCSHY